MRRSADAARRVILEAAERRLVAGGPEAIRLMELAADVGISHSAILHHFGSRDGLMEALVAHGFERFREQVEAGWPSETTPDVSGAFERFERLAVGQGYARLLAWLVLSGRGGAMPRGLARRLAARMHEGRTRALASEGRPPGSAEGTEWIALLFAVVGFGDALFGPVLRRSLGLADDAATRKRFRAWLGEVVGTYLRSSS